MTHTYTHTFRRSALLVSAILAFGFLLMPKASEAMTISPPMLDFTLNPGAVVSDVIQVYNEEGIPFKIRPVAVNFYVKGDDEVLGSPDFYPADEVRNGYELAPWFEFTDEETIIPPDQRVNIPISIRVPEDAQPGSHFGAIQILASKPDEIPDPEASFIGIRRATSVLVFVRVNGDVNDELSVATFGPDKDVFTHLPIDFPIRVMNTGTTHQRPVGNVIIENTFGHQVASLQVNPGPQYRTVLPGSARRFDVSWFRKRLADTASEYEQQWKNFGIGKYTATLLLNYGSDVDQKVITTTTTFWVFPWMVLLTVLAAVVTVALIVRFGLRGYEAGIIRRYEQRKKGNT